MLLHAHDLGDRRHLAGAVAHAVQLDDQVDRARHLLTDCANWKVHPGHQDQRLETSQPIARAVRVQSRHRPVVARVHGLKHVEGFTATTLADHDALWSHTERVDHESLDRDLAFAVDVLRPRLQPADVLLVQLKLGRVLDCDDAVLDRDEARQHVEEGRLPGAGPTRDDDVRLCKHGSFEKSEARLVCRTEPDQVVHLIWVAGKLADRQQRAVQRERPDHGVHSGSVRKAGVTQRRALVDAAADSADDELDDVEQLVFVHELDVGEDDLARHLDVDVVVAVDHDFGDAVLSDQRLDRP